MAKVLVVEDKRINREFLVTLMRHAGHATLEASDGAEGLEIVQAERPDLVITDILMPKMDGFEFVRTLRRDQATACTPVIFYTATYHRRETYRLANACGISQFLFKPCDPDVIIESVNAVLADRSVTLAPASLDQFTREHPELIADKLADEAAELEAISEQLRALLVLGQRLVSERDPGQLAHDVCGGARDLVGARYAVVGVLDEERQGLRYYEVSGLGDEAVARMGIPPPFAGLLGRVLGERRPVRLTNAGALPESLGLPAGHPRLGSFLGVPLATATHVYGWLYLGDKLGGGEFTAEDEEVAVTLAVQAAIAYENLHRYDEIQRHALRLEWEVAQRERAEEDLRRSSQQLRARRPFAMPIA